MLNVRDLTTHLDALAGIYDGIRAHTEHDDLSGGTAETQREAARLCARTIAAASRLLPLGTTYRLQADDHVARYSKSGKIGNPGGLVLELFELLRAFREDAQAGFLSELEAAIHADIFDDFLEMAEHVLADIHRTPAAVIAGFTLEEQLRRLCSRRGIPLEETDGRPRKADTLNAELAKAGEYTGKTEAKDVTAWLGRRNDAAHGHHDRYTTEQVALMIEGVRGFISRYPA